MRDHKHRSLLAMAIIGYKAISAIAQGRKLEMYSTIYTLNRFDIEFLANHALEDVRYPKEKKKIFLRETGLMAWNGAGLMIQLDLPIAQGQRSGQIEAKALQEAIKACKVGRKKASTIDIEIGDRWIRIGDPSAKTIALDVIPVPTKLFELADDTIKTLDQDTIDGLSLAAKLGAEFALFEQGKLSALDKDREIGIGYRAPNSPIYEGKIVSTWIGSLAKAAQKAGLKEPIMIGRLSSDTGYGMQIGSLLAVATDCKNEAQGKKSSFCLEKAS